MAPPKPAFDIARLPTGTHHQIGALPYRVTREDEVEVLLVTSRGTGSWIVPKGWPMDGFSDPDAAAREAYEEAGVLGEIETVPCGVFHYERSEEDKGLTGQYAVTLYPLLVAQQLTLWPEAHQRRIGWMSPDFAAQMIGNAELGQVVAAFGRNRTSQP